MELSDCIRNRANHLWTELGMRLQSWWDATLDRYGDDSFNLYVYGRLEIKCFPILKYFKLRLLRSACC